MAEAEKTDLHALLGRRFGPGGPTLREILRPSGSGTMLGPGERLVDGRVLYSAAWL